MVVLNSAQSVHTAVRRQIWIIGGQFKIDGEVGVVGICIAISGHWTHILLLRCTRTPCLAYSVLCVSLQMLTSLPT